MIIPVAGEPIIEVDGRGRWEYCRDTETGWSGYLHLDCDAITDRDGHCVMCGAPCPTIWTEVRGSMEEPYIDKRQRREK